MLIKQHQKGQSATWEQIHVRTVTFDGLFSKNDFANMLKDFCSDEVLKLFKNHSGCHNLPYVLPSNPDISRYEVN